MITTEIIKNEITTTLWYYTYSDLPVYNYQFDLRFIVDGFLTFIVLFLILAPVLFILMMLYLRDSTKDLKNNDKID